VMGAAAGSPGGGDARPGAEAAAWRAGGRAASEKIGEATNKRVCYDALTSRFYIGVKTSGPNSRIQIRCIWAKTHLYLGWTAFSDGRIAEHMHMLICRVLSGPFAIGFVPS
jgi:hypothetical protein